jgi:trimeric autotransporter adhesin
MWIGGAPAVAQVDTITIPSDIAAGQVFNAAIGVVPFSYTVPAGATFSQAVTGIVSAWNASEIAQVAEITAAATMTTGASPAPTGAITFTADTAGKPFIVTFTIGDGGNEIQVVTLNGTASSGTFTLTYAGQTTGAIAYNADAATVDAALEALSNIGSGDVTVTGSAGGPWTVEFTGALAATNVSLMTADYSLLVGTNEVQTITLATGASGGTFTLTFLGQTTSAIAYNASAATIELALEALSTIPVGEATVAGAGPWTVTFSGTLGSADVSIITINTANITGGLSGSFAETQAGGGAENDRYYINANESSSYAGSFVIAGNASVTAGTFTLAVKIGGTSFISTTAAIAFDPTAGDIQKAIEATWVGDNGESKVQVTGAAAGDKLSAGDTINFLVQPKGGTSLGAITVTITSSLTGGTYTGSGTNGLYGSGSYTSGESFYLTLNGQTTSDLNDDASAATIQAALESLSGVGAGNVTVTGNGTLLNEDSFGIELVGSLSNTAHGWAFSIGSNSGFSGLSAGVSVTGGGGTEEIQTLTITGSPGSGTFSIDYAGQRTSMIAYNASAATVQTALEALSNIGVGEAVCTGGDLPGSDVVITFAGSLSGIDIAALTFNHGTVEETTPGSGSPSVTIATTQAPVEHAATTASEGPNDWSIAANFNTNTVPVTGDTVYVSDTNQSILYGLDQSAVTLAALHIEQTFSGFIGLPRTNSDGASSYFEYRDQYLKIGATTLFIGDKEGDGSDRIKINLGSVQSTVLITDSGDGEDANTPAILLLGTHASNVININRGSLGVAYYPTEVSTIATLRQAFFDDATDDTNVYLGTGVTITDIVKTGGVLDVNSATTTFKQTAGTTTVHDGAHTVLNLLSGLLNYNSTGTLAAANLSGDAVLVFDQDARPKTVTVIDKYTDDSEIYDVSGSIASPVIDLNNCGDLSTLHMW